MRKSRSSRYLAFVPAVVLLMQMMVTAGGAAVVCIRDNGAAQYELFCLCPESAAAPAGAGRPAAGLHDRDCDPDLDRGGCNDIQISYKGINNTNAGRGGPSSPPALFSRSSLDQPRSFGPIFDRSPVPVADGPRPDTLSSIILLI